MENGSSLIVADAVDYLLHTRRGEIKSNTFYWYRQCSKYIVGPLLLGTRAERIRYGRKKVADRDAKFLELLGPVPIADLTTGQIRQWHRALSEHVSLNTANAAKKMLRAALALAGEELSTPVPPMPVRFGRGRSKTKKLILSTEQIGQLLDAARQDHIMGVYYAFPFLTGVRISEQLALRWPDIDTIAGVITVRSMQEINGTITSFTKTAAGMREIPIAPMLLELLNSWKESCPTFDSGQGRVFPSLGRVGYARSRERPLTYANYLTTYWYPALRALGLPPVSPHSARHAFISNLQAQGIEVGLVAKLAGHSSISVTLSHYTQAVRGGEHALRALEHAYRHTVAVGSKVVED